MRVRFRLCAGAAAIVFVAAGCGAQTQEDASETATLPQSEQEYPDVVEVAVESEADGSFRVAVTLSSPYDTPERYADGWRVVGPDGSVLGERELAHDHADEQPFTRTLDGVEIPANAEVVVVEARDSTNGYGGEKASAPVPHPGS